MGENKVRAVTQAPKHHFFGYYDKFPWDATGRYMLALETDFIDRPPTGKDPAGVGLIDLQEDCKWQKLDETYAWCWQQGTMLQWLPSAPDRLIIYNQLEKEKFISIIKDLKSGEVRKLPRPIYALSPDGESAVTLNFARVQRTRPGYGYPGVQDQWEDELHPLEDGIYRMNLSTGDNNLIVSLHDIANFNRDETMENAVHWFNHLQFNIDGSRFLFLHRWKKLDGTGWFTRLFTANPDGSDLYCVADHGMVSHFDWYDARKLLAWARQHDVGDRFFLFTDNSTEKEVVGEGILTKDGHCSYSPDRRWILLDTYPDAENKRRVLLYRIEDRKVFEVGSFYSPPELEGEIRCDLHPRWNRDGTKVCIDSAHEGTRQLYVIDVSEVVSQ